jgi:Zn-dependent protease
MFWFFRQDVNFQTVFIRAVALTFVAFLVLPLHEFAHAFVAAKCGDNTAFYQGRMSLNPVKHISWPGLVCMFLFGFGWAKPVPYDSRNFYNKKIGTILTAAAGPVFNILAAMLGAILCRFFLYHNFVPDLLFKFVLKEFLVFYIQTNIVLAAFNLIPVPPLDGFSIFGVFLPSRTMYFINNNMQAIQVVSAVLIFTGTLRKFLLTLSNILNFLFISWILQKG